MTLADPWMGMGEGEVSDHHEKKNSVTIISRIMSLLSPMVCDESPNKTDEKCQLNC